MTILKERESTVAVVVPPEAVHTAPPKQPGRVRRFVRLSVGAIARHPKLTKAFLLIAITSGTSCFLLYLLFRGAWSSDQNNLAVLSTIFKMEISRESTLALNENPQQVVTRSYRSLDPYVAADDWTWINRFGSTITYGRRDQRLIASCSSYSPLYIICSLSEIP